MKTKMIVIVILVFLFFACSNQESYSSSGEDSVMNIEIQDQPVELSELTVRDNFYESFYEPVFCEVDPQMPTAGLPFNPSKIINLNEIQLLAGLSGTPSNLLENGFTVKSTHLFTDNPVEAFEVLESYHQPVYISSGIALHLMHIFFDESLKYIEQKYLFSELFSLLDYLYQKNLERGNLLGAAYTGVPLKLLDPEYELDRRIEEKVNQDLEYIEQHQGFQVSAVFGYKEDFSQYVPRGHYDTSDSLKRYFKAMMWLGRLTFLAKGNAGSGDDFIVSREQAIEFTATAVQIISDLCSGTAEDGESYLEKWNKIYSITAFFAGFADDLSVPDYLKVLNTMDLENLSVKQLYEDEFYDKLVKDLVEQCGGPKIYSGTGALVSWPDEQNEFDPEDLQKAFEKTLGFRLFGQRYAFDSEVLGLMVFPNVGANPAGNYRYMPSGLDVAAVFNSPAAYEILCQQGDTNYERYNKIHQHLVGKLSEFDQETWHSTLYNSWLYCLYLVIKPRAQGYADFMTTDAWDYHCASNFLASWAVLRHDNILYVKQSYTMEAGCAPDDYDEPPPPPSAGFVEPVPEVYAEVIGVLLMLQSGLQEYGYLDDQMEWRYDRAIYLMERLQEIAETELSGEPISEQDADFLKYFSTSLKSAIAGGEDISEGLETTLIADVHTDQNSSSVLEVGSGNLDLGIVVYQRPDGHLEAAVGPVLSYYEFTWPMGDRLTDTKWREMIERDQQNRPDWVYVED